jgi:hypothetical protein
LQYGGGEGVVDDQERARPVRDVRGSLEVGEAHERIGRRLDQNRNRSLSTGILDTIRIP